jgi:hypothetical protein
MNTQHLLFSGGRVRTYSLRAAIVSLSLLTFVAGPGVVQTQAQAPDSAAVQEDGVEVLTRGPIHEAFAETVAFKPVAGIMVPKAPPTLVEELPPDQRPEGDRVQWIPGYWNWDEEGNEFLWVSGIWRNIPPGRQWIPGYWQESGAEWQWVSGYWANAEVEDVEYLPEPPASVEAGPNIKRPSSNSVWIPGSWRWNDSRYLWSGGYWDDARPDWMWMPSYYNWTPRGYVYVDGYWDYSVARRGVLFAPVRFHGDYYSRPSYRYSPLTVISLALLSDHLFLRPRYRHYYFGDYYSPIYRERGYHSWHTYYSGRHGYDPFYAHQRWTHRDDNRWERRVAENYAFFRDNQDERPPHTLSAFQAFASREDHKRRGSRDWVAPLSTIASRQDSPLRLKAVNEEERQRYVSSGREIRNFSDRWKKASPVIAPAETAPAPDGSRPAKGTPRTEPARVKMPKSPIAAKVTDQAAPADTPPPPRSRGSVKEDRPRDTADPKMRPGDRVTPDATPQPLPGEKPAVTPKDPTDDPRRRDPKLRPGRPSVEPKEQPQPTPKVEPRDTPPDTSPKVRPRDNPAPTPKVQPREQPTAPNPKIRPRVEPTPTPKVEPREQPRSTPRVEPKMQPRVEPREQPRSVPKVVPREQPQPKITPREQPRSNPKVTPREQPRAAPAPRPAPAPRVAPTPRPQPQPQPRSAPAPRKQPSNPSDDEKDKKRR